jgi:hypothetical protein
MSFKKIFKNRVLKGILGPKTQEATEGSSRVTNLKERNFGLVLD